MNPLPTHIPLYYCANPPTLNTRQYIAQGLVYPMKTVHTVQSFLDTFAKMACNSESSVPVQL